jgi:hypothetical protein
MTEHVTARWTIHEHPDQLLLRAISRLIGYDDRDVIHIYIQHDAIWVHHVERGPR